MLIFTNIDGYSQFTKTSTENHSDPLTSSKGICFFWRFSVYARFTWLSRAPRSAAVAIAAMLIIVRSRMYGSYIWHQFSLPWFDPVVSKLQHLTSHIYLIWDTLKQLHRSMEKPLWNCSRRTLVPARRNFVYGYEQRLGQSWLPLSTWLVPSIFQVWVLASYPQNHNMYKFGLR